MNVPYQLVKLGYDPNTCVLLVEWPDFTESFYNEVQFTFDVIINKVRSTNAKYLLSVYRKANIKLSEPKFKTFIHDFFDYLAKTQIEKVARVAVDSTIRKKSVNEVTEKTALKVPVRNFQSKEEALQWLTSN